MVHRSMFGSDLPPDQPEKTYRNGVTVLRTPRGWEVLVNGKNLDPGGYTFDDPARAHEEAETLESCLDAEPMA
jgi:hypothetical protein